jgi:hypothetical protein
MQQVVNRLNYALKIINRDTTKIVTNKMEYHKAIIHILRKKKKMNSTHPNLGNVRAEWKSIRLGAAGICERRH